MARIQGVDLQNKKRIDIALTSIFGIGRFLASEILKKANIDPSRKTSDITEAELARIRNVIQNDRNDLGDPSYRVEGDLRKFNAECIKRLIDIKSYRGLRHKKGLPVRGQRTSTNARTRKGPRRSAVKKK
jgi:small subunit ribosomal protein S13